MAKSLSRILIELYTDALKAHTPPLDARQRGVRARNDIARLLDAVDAAGYRLTLHAKGAEQQALDLEEE